MSVAPSLDERLEFLYDVRDRQRIAEEAERMAQSLPDFVRGAWPILKPQEDFYENWHHHAIWHHLEAVSAAEISKLQIWVPPGTMKSMNVSIFWPAWEWTWRPMLRYWSASYAIALSWDLCGRTRDLLVNPWFRLRWGHLFEMTKAGESEYANNVGGTRIATTPGSGGLGKHGHRIILDDLLDAGAAEAEAGVIMKKTNEWYDTVIFGRQLKGAAQVLIMQRLHESDVAAHALEVGDWTVLCLPERYEPAHPYAWRNGRVDERIAHRLQKTELEEGDPREENGLLWPDLRDDSASDEYARRLGRKAAGQLQQRPASKEGEIIMREWWRFYDQDIRLKEEWHRLPKKFTQIIVSVDTPLKDKETSDNVAIQVWGVAGADRFLLDLDLGKMNYGKAKRRVREMSLWARRNWPHCAHRLLIENAGYGVELIVDMKKDLTGVTKITAGAEGTKISRAESATDALESGNVYLPGIGPPRHAEFNEAATSSDIVSFIGNLANFPFAANDDDVDAWSQCMNWLRSRQAKRSRIHSAASLIRAGR
jgi:hypothetical protein